jgi:hypothetical protein
MAAKARRVTPPLYLVEWRDAATFDSNVWRSRDELANLGTFAVHSVGFLLKRNKEHIVLAAHLAEHAGFGELAILRGSIRKMTRLK